MGLGASSCMPINDWHGVGNHEPGLCCSPCMRRGAWAGCHAFLAWHQARTQCPCLHSKVLSCSLTPNLTWPQVIEYYAQKVVALNANKPQTEVAKQIDKALH